MATPNLTYLAPNGQKTTSDIAQPNMQFVLSDGIHFDSTIGEHVVVVGGEIVNYAFHWSTAAAQFREASRVRREHLRRDSITCPSCGGGMDETPKYWICIVCGYKVWK